MARRIATERQLTTYHVLQYCSIMKTATVRDLRNRYSSLLSWISAGEEIVITQRGKTIARLVPAQDEPSESVDWSQSPAVKRDRSAAPSLSVDESMELIHEAGGKW
jgi:prevent-host-death family protein